MSLPEYSYWYENKTDKCMWIYVNLLHSEYCKPFYVLVTFCDHLHGGVLWRVHYKGIKTLYKYKILSFKYVIQNVLKFKVQNILRYKIRTCILYFNIFCITYFKLNILYLYTGFDVFYNISFRKHLPDDGHRRWLKPVGGLQHLEYNKFTYLHMRLMVLFS